MPKLLNISNHLLVMWTLAGVEIMKTVVNKEGKLACNITTKELQEIKKELRPTTRKNDSLYEIFKQIAEEDKAKDASQSFT